MKFSKQELRMLSEAMGMSVAGEEIIATMNATQPRSKYKKLLALMNRIDLKLRRTK